MQDMNGINKVVERAIMTWKLPERVKRLSLPSYRYQIDELDPLHIVVAIDAGHDIVGVAARETANPRDVPRGQRGLLLHGLYVDPASQHQGIGTHLLDTVLAATHDEGYDGLLVKSKADANGFFAKRGLQKLEVEDLVRDYPHRFWLFVRET